LKTSGYRPREYYEQNPRLHEVLDFIGSGTLTGGNDDLFDPLLDDLVWHDPFMLLADFQAYIDCQDRVNDLWRNQKAWTRTSILNVARMGKFSSDRSIRDYCQRVWNIEQVSVKVM
jgi:starch phosphorylase